MTSARLYSVPKDDAETDTGHPAQKPDHDRAEASEDPAARAKDYIRQHPVAAVAIAAGVGMLLQTVLTGAMRGAGQGTGTRKRSAPQSGLSPEPESGHNRTHDVGAAEMEFTTHHPDGKNILFKFAWKKRPTDAAETDWPTDQMGFTASRPDGKHTAFSFTRKTRPLPVKDAGSGTGDNRPGLGRAQMEFVSSHPDRGDFRFTWNKAPADDVP